MLADHVVSSRTGVSSTCHHVCLFKKWILRLGARLSHVHSKCLLNPAITNSALTPRLPPSRCLTLDSVLDPGDAALVPRPNHYHLSHKKSLLKNKALPSFSTAQENKAVFRLPGAASRGQRHLTDRSRKQCTGIHLETQTQMAMTATTVEGTSPCPLALWLRYFL